MTSPLINETAASMLGFLTLGPMTGWDLNELARMSVGNFWNVTRSQVYRELKALEEADLVRGEDVGERSKRRYEITATGRRAFADWLRTPAGPAVTRDPFLVRVFFGDALQPDEFDALVSDARQRKVALLERYRSVLADAESLSPFAAATARYGIAVEEAILAWFDAEPWRTRRKRR
jgi:DNA-binding PadR family transcriptional regulator